MGTDRRLVADLLEAGNEPGEPGWELPLWAPYRRLIDSAVADVPWLHVDTGSSAWVEHETALWPKGAAGSPTRAFVRFVERRTARARA